MSNLLGSGGLSALVRSTDERAWPDDYRRRRQPAAGWWPRGGLAGGAAPLLAQAWADPPEGEPGTSWRALKHVTSSSGTASGDALAAGVSTTITEVRASSIRAPRAPC